MMARRTRDDVLRDLLDWGFEVNELGARRVPGPLGNGPRPVLIRLRGRLFAQVSARLNADGLARLERAAVAELRRQGLDTNTAIDRHARDGGTTVEVGDLPEGGDLATLRKVALVDSLGRPRAERVRMYLQYREAYRERFGSYPVERPPRGSRLVLGRCYHCEQPQDQECLPDCAAVDPLAASEPPTTPPRGVRPWSPSTRRRRRSA